MAADDDPPVITLRKVTVVRVGIAVLVLAALGAGVGIGLAVGSSSPPALPSNSTVTTTTMTTSTESTEVFSITSGAMEPTLQIGDRIVVNTRAYADHAIQRGDIVVFRRPADENCGGPPVTDLVKRVIGLPGETISLTNGAKGYVVIDGKRLDETWLPSSVQGQTFPGPAGTAYNLTRSYRVPAGHYFVMGDNRTDSCDSRYWGPVAKSLIVGKVESAAR